jgi:hypothetical protein
VFEAVAVVAGFNDVAVMSQTVQQRRRHLIVYKHVSPLREAQIRGIPVEEKVVRGSKLDANYIPRWVNFR